MSAVRAILKWLIRIAFFFICMLPYNWRKDNGTLAIMLWELFCSFMSLIRVEPDEIIRVITGFGPDGEYGFYEYNDNSAMRIVGFLFWLAAFALRLFMLHCIWHQLFMGGVQLK